MYATNQVNEWMNHILSERHMNATFYETIQEYLENLNKDE
jgi:hypothetical protein